MRKFYIFVIAALLVLVTNQSKHVYAEFTPFPGGGSPPEIKVIDDILTANIYGSLAVQSVYFDDVLKRVTRTFRSFEGDSIVIAYDPSSLSWVTMKTPDRHYMLTKLNATTYEIKDLITGQAIQETHSGAHYPSLTFPDQITMIHGLLH